MEKLKKLTLAVLVLASILVVCACGKDIKEPTTESFDLGYKLQEDEEIEPFFATDSLIYAAVLKKDPPSTMQSMFGAKTEKFIVYDTKSSKVTEEYAIKDTDAYIYNAMPFEDGIIYSTYLPKTKKDNGQVPWSINYVTQDDSITVDSGHCRSNMNTPGFANIGEDIYYLYEDFVKESKYGFGIRKADLEKPKEVLWETKHKLSENELYSNGTDFAIMVEGKINDGKANVLIGNVDGIYNEYDFPEKITSMGLCKDYLFCCTTSDGEKYSARSIALESGEEYDAELEEPLYRIASMKGNELTCVAGNWGMCILHPGKEFKKVSVEDPEKIIDGREFVRYYPYGESGTFAQLDDKKFCRLTW